MNFNLLPLVSLSKLWHVGTLNTSDKGVHGPSNEGAGLSISQHPDYWIRIAKLGGQPVWSMTRKDGAPGRFISWLSLSQDARDAVASEALSRGLLATAVRYEVCWFDTDDCEHRFVTFTSSDEAALEREELIECESNEVDPVKVVQTYIATPLLEKLAGQQVADVMAVELALTVMLEDEPSIDGLWWEAKVDVLALSAPRGVITKAAVCRWQGDIRLPN